MGIFVMQSNWLVEDGVLTERNMHKEIHEHISDYDVNSIEHLKLIDEQIALLKEKGFDLSYNLMTNTNRLDQMYKVG